MGDHLCGSLYKSLINDHYACFNKLVSMGYNVNQPIGWARITVLDRAIVDGRHDYVTALLNHELTNINAQDIDGHTPLHKSVFIHNIASIIRLLDRGANINTKDHLGNTPLDYASEEIKREVMDYLLASEVKEPDHL